MRRTFLLSVSLVVTLLSCSKVAFNEASTSARLKAETQNVAAMLNRWYRAADQGDADGYFACFTKDAVFLGTDPAERWALPAFRKRYPHPKWTYTPRELKIVFSSDYDTGWFDQNVYSPKLDSEMRSTGVVVRSHGEWLIASYSLLFTIPNGLVPKMIEDVKAWRLAKWKPVVIPFNPEGLSSRERQTVEKLVEACRLLNDLFWRQSDPDGLALYKETPDPTVKQLLSIMGGRWDLLDENRQFAGDDLFPPGHELYPKGMKQEEIDRYIAQHPEEKAAVKNPYMVVKRRGDRLAFVPFHEEYKLWLVPMAHALREAAALSPDTAFARFLNLRADALLTDDYYLSDLAWLELKDPKIDLIFAPYETYLDDVMGVKASFGAAVLIRNDVESQKLASYQKFVPEIQDALPVAPEYRPSKRGHVTPMEVMDSPYRAGDLRYGYQAVADNLPNDARIHQEKGTKKIFFRNFMEKRVNDIILQIALKVMSPEQASKVSADGYLTGTVLHEIAHELGPTRAVQNGKPVGIDDAIGKAYHGLEEAKADVVGMFGVKWLVDGGGLPRERLEEYYASYVAGLLRTVRFGAGEAHGIAEMTEFNYLEDQKALSLVGGKYNIDYVRMPVVIEQLARALLEIEATGDRSRAEALLEKYAQMHAELAHALAATEGIPVDVQPVFSFADRVE